MTNLILPTTELIIPRRSFIKGTALSIASLFVAPAIVPAFNLMEIDSRQNRLVYSFIRRTGLDHNRYPSLMSLVDVLEPAIQTQWESQHNNLEYSLVRWAEILPANQKRFGGSFALYTPDLVKLESVSVKRAIDRFKEGKSGQITA